MLLFYLVNHPQVTFYGLVQDALWRLKNGRGSLDDLTQLIRQSQFLNSNCDKSTLLKKTALSLTHFQKGQILPFIAFDPSTRQYVVQANRPPQQPPSRPQPLPNLHQQSIMQNLPQNPVEKIPQPQPSESLLQNLIQQGPKAQVQATSLLQNLVPNPQAQPLKAPAVPRPAQLPQILQNQPKIVTNQPVKEEPLDIPAIGKSNSQLLSARVSARRRLSYSTQLI